MDAVKTITSVLWVLVIFGIMWQVLRNPQGANSLLASGTSVITNTTNTLKNG